MAVNGTTPRLQSQIQRPQRDGQTTSQYLAPSPQRGNTPTSVRPTDQAQGPSLFGDG